MSLTKYKKKRAFDQTPEPRGGKPAGASLRFVVQKHDASRLHYDFRLEMDGVLKSWAVPKGPSMDTGVKRLAMMVEDHPFDYRTFEGTIPEGNYGAGTVMVWDEGFYEPAEEHAPSKEAQDKALRRQLHQGKVKFILRGKKLNGLFALVKASGRGENAWLLMKLSDEFATNEDVLDQDLSVVSSRSMSEIAKGIDHKSNGHSRKSVQRSATKSATKPARSRTNTSPRQTAKQTAGTPKTLSPMLATLVDKPFHDDGWVYEVKWDGYRAVSFVQAGQVNILSRNNKSFDEKFYPIRMALESWNVNAVVDGEIVVLDDKGLSDFSALQNWRSEADGHLLYYVFDLLWLDGSDLTDLPLALRKELLKEIMPDHELIRFSETFQVSGTEIYERAEALGLEGIIAKKIDSVYSPGHRSTDWLKIKVKKRQEVVIGGYTRNEDSTKLFSSILVGVYEGDTLVYTGKVGTGFTHEMQKDMLKQFDSRVIKKSPFDIVPDVNKPSRFRPDPPSATATWLKPELVCEVSFSEMTSDGVMRHPSFEGMRDDKKPSAVVREKAIAAEEVVDANKTTDSIVAAPKGKQERKSLLNPTDETQVRQLAGHEIKFTNLSKVYWPDEKVTKRDMINYYYQIAPVILPYLINRPQSLNRFPNGIKGKSFYQKDVTGKVPDWVETYLYHSSDSPEDKHFMVPKSEADVLLMANMGCIELNPWSSTIKNPDKPDWCIIDLDPDKNSFNQVIEAAQVTKAVLDAVGVPSYCKTSGSTGLHIYIPLGAKYSYEQSKEFARIIVTLVNNEIPEYTSIERMVSNRKGKMYLDFLQNRPQATLAAPYALRPKPGATVSMPLHWDEVKKGLTLQHFTIFNAVERVRSEGDLFKPVIGKGINLEQVMKKLEGWQGKSKKARRS